MGGRERDKVESEERKEPGRSGDMGGSRLGNTGSISGGRDSRGNL